MDTNNDQNEIRDAYAIALGERIRQCRQGMTREAFASYLDLHVNTVGKFERGVTVPDAFTLVRIADVGKCSPEWLLTGSSKSVGVELSAHAVETADHIYVPHFDVAMSAGNGLFCDVERVIAMRPFDIRFVRYDLGIAHNDLALTSVAGRSMETTLHSGYTILLDLRAKDLMTEGIHAIRLDGALMVKSLQRMPNRQLRVSSANPEFAPFDVDLVDQQRDFEVLGRVRWGGITFA